MKTRQFLSLFLCIAGSPLPLLGNPIGGTVTAGSASISQPGPGVLHINQTSDRAIINWNSFSIGSGELTRFVQPSVNSATLNRVLSGNPSEIYGTLQANGHVYLINPSGILVGPGGQINTHSFIGSTLNVSDDHFLAGVGMRLSGSSTASVNNQGSIQALGGDVFLFAHTVENSGVIRAPGGTVGLAAGSEVLLQQAGASERIAVSAGNTAAPQAATGVNNVGAIQAAAAELKAAGGNIYALAINNGGVVRANGLIQENGRIVLKATGGNIRNSGTLSARNANGSGGSITVDGGHNDSNPSTVINSGTIEARGMASGVNGGDVKIVGDRVGLTDHALVDVSGDAGGGVALVGGDLHGANSDVQNSQRTLVGPDAAIKADALNSGNGGKVVVWADEWTRFFGSISAVGGKGGNGGFAEISGKNLLDFVGTVNLSGGSGGQNGTVLLDPATITVQLASPDINGDGTPGDDITALTDLNNSANFPGANSVITSAAVSALLSGNSTLVLAAVASETINASIVGSGNANLTLNAPIVNINSSVSLAGSGALSGNGTFNINAPIRAGSVSLNAVNFGVSGSTTLNPSILTSGDQTYSGAVTLGQDTVLSSSGGNVTLGSTVNSSGNGITTSDQHGLEVSASGLTLNGVIGGNADGALGTLTLGAKNALALNHNITAQAVTAKSGTDGVGDLSFGASVIVSADTQVYQAGNGQGGSGQSLTAQVDLTTHTPQFRSMSGANAPSSFTYQQDGAIGSADPPAAGQFGGTTPMNYTLQSDDGSITMGTSALFANSAGTLTINAAKNILFSANFTLTLDSFSAHSGRDGNNSQPNNSITFGGTLVQINASHQTYQAGDGLGNGANAIVNLTGNTPTFRNSGNSGAPMSFSYEQDESIANGDIPSTSQFGSAVPGTYTIQSDEGSLALSTAANVQGSALTLSAHSALTISGAAISDHLNLASLSAAGSSITLGLASSSTANPSIKTTGPQTYTGPVTLSQDTVLESTVNGDVQFTSTIDGAKALEVNTAGTTTFGGVVGAGTALTSLTTDQSAASPGSKGGSTIFNITASGTDAGVNAGTVTINDAATLNISSSTASHPSVRTTAIGGQAYNGAVTLSQDTILDAIANGPVAFGSTVGGANSLTINTAGATTFGGTVGAGAALTSLTTDSGGTVAFNFAAPSVGIAAGVNAGTLTLNDPATLNISGSSAANPSIRTGSGGQSYNAAVTLSKDTVLESTANGPVAFGSTVNGANALSVNTGGATTFGGVIGGSTALSSLTTDLGGTVAFNFTAPGSGTAAGVNAGTVSLNDAATFNIVNSSLTHPSVRTGSGGQSYNAAVTLSKDTVLESTANGPVAFGLTIDGANDLTVNTGGATSFGGVIGAVAALTSLTTDAGGTVAFNFSAPGIGTAAGVNVGTLTLNDPATLNIAGSTTANPSVRTGSGGQSYNAALTLDQNTVLASTSSGDIAFGSTIDSKTLGSERSLEINTAGNEMFGDRVGGNVALLSLTTDADAGNRGGKTIFNVTGSATATPSVRTTGGQTYNDTVQLNANTVLESTANGNVSFASTINSQTAGSERSLEINTKGDETFNARVGGTVALLSLTTDADPLNSGGQAIFSVSGSANATPTVRTTTGDQIYNDAAQLNQDTVLAAAGGSGSRNVTFNSTINGAHSLTVNSPGVTHFDAQIGNLIALTSLTTDALGSSELCAGANATTLTLPDLSTIGGVVNSVSPLLYGNSITLCHDTTITAPSVSFSSTVNGANNGMESLTISGDATFNGAVGMTIALKSLSVGGSSAINGGGIKTAMVLGGGSGDQTYTGPVTLGDDTVLMGAIPTFGATVTGNNHDLTLNFSGPTLIDGATFSGIKNLASGNGGLTQLQNAITTSGSQTYDDDVQLSANTSLDTTGGGGPGAAITFNGKVDAATVGLETLALTAGNAPITFANTVGSSALGAVTINSASDFSVAAFNAASLRQVAGSGTTTLNGPVNTTDAAGVDLNTAAISMNGAIDTSGGGVHLAATTAISSTPSGTITTTSSGIGPSGPVQISASGSGTIDLHGAISTRGANNAILPGPGGAVNINTLGGALSVANINTSGGSASVPFFGANAGAISLSAGGPNTLTLNGTLTALGGFGIPFGAGGTISLDAGNGVIQQIGNVLGANLLLTGSGNFSLTHSGNHVDVIAANVNGPISYTDGGSLPLHVGIVGPATGITANNNQVALTTDQLEIDQAISSGTARTVLEPLTAGRDVQLGNGTLSSSLNLSQTELDHISAGVLEISQAGHIDVSAPISLNPANVSSLSLLNNAAIDGAGSLAVQNLRLSSAGPVNLSGPNNVGVLAASISGANQSFYFRNLGDLTIGAVDTVAGVSTADGNLTLVSGGNLALASDLTAGAGTVTIFNAGTLSGAGNVTAAALNLQGAGNVGGSGAGNALNTSVDAITLAKSGGNTFLNQAPGQSVDIGGTSGGGDVTLTAGATTVNNAALDAGGANITLNTTTLGLAEDVKGSSVTIKNSAALTRTAGTVSGNTLNLQGDGQVGASGSANNLNTSVGAITLAKGGGDTFLNQDTATAVDIGGGTGGANLSLSAGAVTVNNAALDAGAGNVTLNTTTLGLAQNIKGAAVTIDNSGALNRSAGTVSASTLTLQGGGSVGTGVAANNLNTSVDAITLAKSGGNSFISQDTAKTVDIGGVSGGGNVTLNAGAVTVNNAALDAGAGNVVLNTTTLGLAQDVAGAAVTINNSGSLTRSAGTVRGSLLTLQGNGTVGAIGAANNLNTSVNSIALVKGGGDTFINQDSAKNVDIGGSASGNLTLTAGAATLDTLSVDANLKVSASGPIDQKAGTSLNVSGLADLRSSGSGAAGEITLNNPGNNFGSLGLNSANGDSVSVTEASGTTLDTVSTAGALSITSGGDIVQTPGKTITVGGNAVFTAPGALDLPGPIHIPGNSINLNNAGNRFNGGISFVGAGGGNLLDVSVSETADLIINAITIDGTLSVHSDGNIQSVGAVIAPVLTASAGGDILFGAQDAPGAGAAPASGFVNRIDNLQQITTSGGQFYLNNLSGINVLGPIQARRVVIRAVGDVNLGDSADHTAHIVPLISGGGDGVPLVAGGPKFDVILSAETLNPALRPEFHNYYGANAIQPGLSFIIFSFDPILNTPSANIGQNSLNFNGLTAAFQNNSSSYASPGSVGDSTAFLFASPAAQISQAASESAKAFVDVMKINPYTGAGSSEADVPLPPIFPTIWTSSYEVYRLEKADSVKKEKKKVSLKRKEIKLSLAAY